MSAIRWSSALELGIPAIDAEHIQLVEMANELLQAMHDGRTADVVDGVVARLQAYVITHFAHEEAMLTRHLYPQFSAHKKLHEQFKSELHELLQAPLAGKISLSMAALAMIRDWLVEHIGNSDRAFADYIHKTISTPPAARSAFLNFDDAVRAHFVAMDKLVAYLSNPSGSSPASDVYKDDQCPLGRWIYGAGRAHADNREYTELRTVHAEFHRSAGQLLEVANQGRSVANRMTLGSDSAFARSSSAIVKAIMALRAKL